MVLPEWNHVEDGLPDAGKPVVVMTRWGEAYKGVCQNNSVYCFQEQHSMPLSDCVSWRYDFDDE